MFLHVKSYILRLLLISLFVICGYQAPALVSASNLSEVSQTDNSLLTVYLFARGDCGYCQQLTAYLEKEKINYEYLDIVKDESATSLYNQVTAKHQLAKVTPITVVGGRVFVGFNGPLTTGVEIKKAMAMTDSTIRTIEDHLTQPPQQAIEVGSNCSELECESNASAFTFDLPILGVVDLRSFSLFTLSIVLGVIDGFNPCAMWVLVTFLVLLSQAGSRQKMIVLAGIFMVAEAVMYNLILNVWYKTWDFVALDQFVTPLVGALALGGGSFFLFRWYKSKPTQLVCDITDIETQSKTINKFKQIVSSPITLSSIIGILIIAFSVNIIEFACSIGIPQAYTKILELNGLLFIERQWYILIYTLGYMFDDLVVFGLAIWGFSRLEAHGGKYAQLSLLIGGVLMLILGGLLIINPGLLVL